MIFFTFGTEKFPFQRLADAADLACERFPGEEIYAQIGRHPDPPLRCRWERLLSFKEFNERVRAARLVVTHAGAGSLLTCFAHGKVPVAVPRLHRHGEHVDDHQQQLAAKVQELGRALIAETAEQVVELLADHERRAAELSRRYEELPQLGDALAFYLTERLAGARP